jgi:hypothetical protein
MSKCQASVNILQKLSWAVDFYNTDLLNKDILALSTLRANTADVYQKASDGDNFSFFIYTWNNISGEDRIKWSHNLGTFKEFVAKLVGSNGTGTERYLPIVQHQDLFKAIQAFVAIPWGRSVFNISNVYRIIGCHLDFVGHLLSGTEIPHSPSLDSPPSICPFCRIP